MGCYGNDFIASPYVFYPTDTILFSFYDNKVNLTYALNDTIWYRLNAGCNNNNELRGIINKNSVLYLWGEYNIWDRAVSNLIPPSKPTNVVYELNDENVIKIKWDDNSNKETSFGIRRYWEYADIFVPANTTLIEFDIDTLTPGYFTFPFYMYANKYGDYSQFSEAKEGIITNNTIIVDSPNDLDIYPNPVKDVFFVSINASLLSDESIIIHIYNYSGQRVLSIHSSVNQPVNISTLKSGIYLCEITNKQGKKIYSKIIKE